MPRFRITYREPETGEDETVVQEFEDYAGPPFISAEDWAKDYAYSLADKGPYEVERLP